MYMLRGLLHCTMLGLADKPLGLNKTCKKQKKPHRASFQVYK